MATITLTELFGSLENWPGRLFEAPAGTTIVTKTATTFTFSYPAGSEFAGFRVVVSGTGFIYDGDVPIDGSMSRVRVLDAANQPVLTFSSLGTNPIVTDLSGFAAAVFGSQTPTGDGPNADAKMAWSHLMAGNDVINGTEGDDNRGLVGVDAGNDVYNMLGGDDEINGGIGNDTIHGGNGFDILTYRETIYNEGIPAIRGATFNIAAGQVLDPWGGIDTFTGIERFGGSRFADVYNGSADRDRFEGSRGRDTMDGGLNSYDLSGNVIDDRRDEARYRDDYWQGGTRGIRAELELSFVNGSITGTVRDGFGNLDTLIDVERVEGTRFDDTFVGSRTDNHFWGGEGRDRFDGGAGFDTLRMERWFMDTEVGAISVDLTRATAQIRNDGFGNIETALNMEGVISGNGNDRLIGNAQSNYFEAQGGADTMTGGGADDYFLWWDESHFGDRITDFNATVDKLQFDTAGIGGMTTTLTLVNGTAATTAGVGTFIWNTATDTLMWDQDGAGGTGPVTVVVLAGVGALTASAFELF